MVCADRILREIRRMNLPPASTRTIAGQAPKFMLRN